MVILVLFVCMKDIDDQTGISKRIVLLCSALEEFDNLAGIVVEDI